MKKFLFVITLFISTLTANSIDTLVNSAILKNSELKSIEKSIMIANENILLATKYSNPTLSLGLTDIHTNENYNKRDLEPMQAQSIGITQAIPITDKLEINQSIQITNKTILALSLEDKKLLLKSKIYELAYKIAILKEKRDFIIKQKQNLQKIEKLQNYKYQTSNNDVNSIFNTKIARKNFDIVLNNLDTNIQTLKLNLEEITYKNINNIKINTNIDKKYINLKFDNHPKIKALQQQLKLNKQQEAFEEVSKTSDIKLNATYFNRREFQDYVNISVSIPLSIYNTENIKVKKAQLEYLKTKDDLQTLKQNFIISNKILQKELNNSYKNYKLITKDIIALQNGIEKSLNINNKFKNNTIKIIQNLNKTISLKITALDEKTKYFTALSKAIYYEGK
ncbi:TolC family protein [Malaciobacter canalis]|uniref:TolC family protein n=1 Tax=Malaciobacter canalis TaxID=1912871 RepID=UPI00384B72B8